MRAVPGVLIYPGDSLFTDSASVAAAEFTVGGKVGVNQGSVVQLTGARHIVDGAGNELQLTRGAIRWGIPGEGPAPLIIRAPTATLGIRG